MLPRSHEDEKGEGQEEEEKEKEEEEGGESKECDEGLNLIDAQPGWEKPKDKRQKGFVNLCSFPVSC